MVLPFPDGDPARPRPQRLQKRGQAYRAVPEGQARGKGRYVVGICLPLVAGVLDFRPFLLWGYQPVEQLAVVGEQQQPLGGLVQTAYGP